MHVMDVVLVDPDESEVTRYRPAFGRRRTVAESVEPIIPSNVVMVMLLWM